MLERSEASGGGGGIDIGTFLQVSHNLKLKAERSLPTPA